MSRMVIKSRKNRCARSREVTPGQTAAPLQRSCSSTTIFHPMVSVMTVIQKFFTMDR